MTNLNESTRRVQAKIPFDVYDKLKLWANKLGITMSQLSGMAIQGGLDGIIRAVSPYDSLLPEQWAEIVDAMEKGKIKKGDLIAK